MGEVCDLSEGRQPQSAAKATAQLRIRRRLTEGSLSWPTTPQWIVIAVLFSALIGVFFGFYPERKASLLDPIEALRYE